MSLCGLCGIALFCFVVCGTSVSSIPPYSVVFLEEDSEWYPLANSEFVDIRNVKGDLYVCAIPPEPKDNNEELEEISTTTIEAILNKKLDTIRLNTGWWTYEFVYGKNLRQYHAEKQGDTAVIVADYILGSKNEKTLSPITSGDLNLPMVSELYTNGTICGLNQKPRTTQIQYFCNDSSKYYMLAPKEPKTCYYVLSVNVPELCAFPEFNHQPEAEATKILCKYLPKGTQ